MGQYLKRGALLGNFIGTLLKKLITPAQYGTKTAVNLYPNFLVYLKNRVFINLLNKCMYTNGMYIQDKQKSLSYTSELIIKRIFGVSKVFGLLGSVGIFLIVSCAPPPGARWWNPAYFEKLNSHQKQKDSLSLLDNKLNTLDSNTSKQNPTLPLPAPKTDSLAKASDSVQAVAREQAKEASQSSKKADSKDTPLICEANPGTAQGSGQRGAFILEGRVVCDYGKLHFTTSRAVWDTYEERVLGEGGMEVKIDEFHLFSEEGGYNKKDSLLWARRKVRGRDTSGNYSFEAGLMHYYRSQRFMVLYHKPLLRRFSSRLDSTVNPPRSVKDTLIIQSDTLRYSDSTRYAFARSKVVITQGNMKITSDSAELKEKDGLLRLVGKPKIVWENNELQGDLMWLSLKDNKLNFIKIKGNSKGKYEGQADSAHTEKQTYDLASDSLYIYFDKEKPQFMELFVSAQVLSHTEKNPEKINKLAGNYLRIQLDKDQISSAVVWGSASSIYHHFEKEIYQGENWASGDSIHITFEKGKLFEIQINGSAKGSYMGKNKSTKTKADSTSKGTHLYIPYPPKQQVLSQPQKLITRRHWKFISREAKTQTQGFGPKKGLQTIRFKEPLTFTRAVTG